MNGFHSLSANSNVNTNGGETSWPTTNLNAEAVQSQPATQSSARQTTHQSWSSSSTGMGLVGGSADSALLRGMQASLTAFPQFLSQPHTSPQGEPSSRADSRVLPQNMVQPDGTPGLGLGDVQQSTSNTRVGISAMAQTGEDISSPSQHNPSTVATAQARGQDTHQILQRDNGPLGSRNGFQQHHPEAHRPDLDASLNSQQTSPQRSLARAHNQQPYFVLRNGDSPILESAQLQLPSISQSNNGAADTPSASGQFGATNRTAERSLSEANQGSADPMISARHQINSAEGMPAGPTRSLQTTENDSMTSFTPHVGNSHTVLLNGLSREPHNDSIDIRSELAPVVTHDVSQRIVQQPSVIETGSTNPFTLSNVTSPQAAGGPAPFPSWHGSRNSNTGGPHQQNGGVSGADSSN